MTCPDPSLRFRMMLALMLALLPSTTRAETLQWSGTEIQIDDALFAGCYHNAFEGEVLEPTPGSYKAGPQGVQRTKAVLTGAGTADCAMTLTFELATVPAGAAALVIRGLDDRFDHQNPLQVTLNGATLARELVFPQNQNLRHGLNQRYFMGWEDRTIAIPAGTLKPGPNTLTIANTADAFTATNWRYALVDHVTLKFEQPAQVTVHRPGWPIYYYGLTTGPEGHVWPAVAYDDKITLLTGSPLEYNFYVTLPSHVPLGAQGALTAPGDLKQRTIRLHLQTDAPIRVTTLDGQELSAEPAPAGALRQANLTRIVGFATAHPAQGVRLFLAGGRDFADQTLTVWWSVDGVDYQKKSYPLRSVSLEPIPQRQSLNFLLSLWGGNAPEDPVARAQYIRMLQGAGFNHQFTGASDALNQELQNAGFKVYPRFGWFGHQFKVTDDTRAWAAIDPKGQPLDRDFCPLAILAQPEHPELGKFFHRARQHAALKHIDGLCVDYETAPVWCYCDNCLALFTQQTGRPVADRALLAGEGPDADAYRDFGRGLNRQLLEQVKAIMLQENPHLEYHCLASAADLPTYWYDGRVTARHAVQELVKFADAIYGSHYCYETPGGLAAVIPVVNTIKSLAVNSGRNVACNLISPVATTVSEHPRYRGVHLRPDFTRLLILLTASAGGGGVSLFRGDCMDGEQLSACRQAISELVAIRAYLQGLNRNFEIELAPVDVQRPVYDTEMAQNLLSRLVWRPSLRYQYDAVQLLKDKSGRDRLLILFNYARQPMTFKVTIRGLYDPSYTLANFQDGAPLGQHSRLELEAGSVTLTVPPRNCLFVRMTADTPDAAGAAPEAAGE